MDKLKMKIAEDAIRKIAADSGESVESVRRNIQIAMVNGLASTDADVQRFWQSVPPRGRASDSGGADSVHRRGRDG